MMNRVRMGSVALLVAWAAAAEVQAQCADSQVEITFRAEGKVFVISENPFESCFQTAVLTGPGTAGPLTCPEPGNGPVAATASLTMTQSSSRIEISGSCSTAANETLDFDFFAFFELTTSLRVVGGPVQITLTSHRLQMIDGVDQSISQRVQTFVLSEADRPVLVNTVMQAITHPGGSASTVSGPFYTVDIVPLQTVTFHWINPAGGSWGEPSNWECNLPPTAADHVAIFDLGGAFTINFAGFDQTAGQLLVRNTSVGLFDGSLFGSGLVLRAPTIAEPSLAIGDSGQVVLNDGEINCENAVVGDLADNPAAVATLELLGSLTETPALKANGTVLIGAVQKGRLDVTNGKLECNTLQLVGSGSGATVANFSGPLTIVKTVQLDAGVLGSAQVGIFKGAVVSSDAVDLGGLLGASSIIVDGSNTIAILRSKLKADRMTVGANGPASFEIVAGGLAELDRLTLGSADPTSAPQLKVAGVTGSILSQLEVTGLAEVLGSDAQVTVSEKGQVKFLGDLTIRQKGSAFFDVIGPDTFCTVGGTLTIAGSPSSAQVNVSEGGVFSRQAAGLASLVVGDAVGKGAIVITHPIERFNDPVPSSMHFTNVDIVNGSVRVEGAGILAADQTLTVRDRLEVDSNLLSFNNVVCDRLDIKDGGVVRCCPSGRIVAAVIINEVGATIEGDANVFGNVITSGLTHVGCSPGTLTIEGDFEQTETGVLEIEVAGLDAGQFAVLKVTGDATLAGAVDLRFIDGFVPQPGDAFDFVVVDGTITGILKGDPRIEIPPPPDGGGGNGGGDGGGGGGGGGDNDNADDPDDPPLGNDNEGSPDNPPPSDNANDNVGEPPANDNAADPDDPPSGNDNEGDPDDPPPYDNANDNVGEPPVNDNADGDEPDEAPPPGDESPYEPKAIVGVVWEVTPEGTCRVTVTDVQYVAPRDEPADRPTAAACGAGACGSGAAPAALLMLMGSGLIRGASRRTIPRRRR